MTSLKNDGLNFLSNKDIEKFLNTGKIQRTGIEATKFILATLICGNNKEEINKLNFGFTKDKIEFYLNNLSKADYFDENGKAKIDENDENFLAEIHFARYIAEGIFVGRYVEQKHYKFDFSSTIKKIEENNEKGDKEIFKYNWINIVEDRNTGQLYLKKNDSTVVIPFIDKTHVILEYQFRPAIQKYSYEFPAGGLFGNKSFKCSVNKMLLEETGYIAKNIKLLTEVYPSPGIYSSKHYYIVARNVVPVQKPNKNIDVRIFDFNKIGHYIESGDIFDNKTIFAYLYYKSNKFKI